MKRPVDELVKGEDVSARDDDRGDEPAIEGNNVAGIADELFTELWQLLLLFRLSISVRRDGLTMQSELRTSFLIMDTRGLRLSGL